MRDLLYLLCCICTAMLGYHIHGSLLWAIVDFIFCPFALAKWLICHELTLTVVRETFGFFFT